MFIIVLETVEHRRICHTRQLIDNNYFNRFRNILCLVSNVYDDGCCLRRVVIMPMSERPHTLCASIIIDRRWAPFVDGDRGGPRRRFSHRHPSVRLLLGLFSDLDSRPRRHAVETFPVPLFCPSGVHSTHSSTLQRGRIRPGE